nr:MAG TPA: hypothetical protein [Caudoviricetes sp.]
MHIGVSSIPVTVIPKISREHELTILGMPYGRQLYPLPDIFIL